MWLSEPVENHCEGINKSALLMKGKPKIQKFRKLLEELVKTSWKNFLDLNDFLLYPHP